MSVDKMQSYKEQKRNRKDILKKQKRQKLIARILVVVVCLAIVGGIAYGIGYTIYQKSAGTDGSSVNLSAMDEYMESLETTTATP